MCDLRGYGDSSKPEGEKDHSTDSKRPMALDGVEVMKHPGYSQFRMVTGSTICGRRPAPKTIC